MRDTVVSTANARNVRHRLRRLVPDPSGTRLAKHGRREMKANQKKKKQKRNGPFGAGC